LRWSMPEKLTKNRLRIQQKASIARLMNKSHQSGSKFCRITSRKERKE
jgi:hypothetical protein